MEKDKLIPKRQTGGEIPYKFDKPLKLEEIPTQNKIHVINNYSPRYDYIVEGDKVYYAKKGKNFWVDISDNDKARANLYNFLGDRYDFRGYEDGEKDIWNQIKQGTFNYRQYREQRNRPQEPQPIDTIPAQPTPVQPTVPTQERLVTVRVGTAGGGFTNIQVPEYMTSKGQIGLYDVKPEYLSQAYQIAREQQPERYADPINNAGNWLPFIILTGGRGLENMGYRFISPLVEKMAQKASGLGESIASGTGRLASNVSSRVAPVLSNLTKGASNFLSKVPQSVSNLLYSTPARQALTKATIGTTTASTAVSAIAPYLRVEEPQSDYEYLWNTLIDEGPGEVYGQVKNGLTRRAALNDPDYVDPVTNFNTQPVDTTSMYGIRPLSVVGDTIPVARTSNRFQINLPDGQQYILPESILPGDYQFSTRNRGDFTPLNTEGAIITSMHRFFPYESRQQVSDRGVRFQNYIGIDRNGKLKAGPVEIFGPGDMMAGTIANEIVSIDTDENGNVVGQRQTKNRDKFYPTFTYIDEGTGQEKHTTTSTALNFLMSPNNPNSANMYGSVYGGRVLIKAGDELRLVSGSVNDINREFEAMKERNGVRSATFYTLDNGTYAKGIRTYNQRITANDLREYDRVNTTGGSFMYIRSRVPHRDTFRSDTIPTPNIRTVDSESYKRGHGLVNEQKGIVLHHTGFMDDPSLAQVTDLLTTPQRPNTKYQGNSAHVIIGEDGSRRVLATPDKVTFHAGSSRHNGRMNVNDFMIGIEFQGDTNKRDLTPQQIASAVEYMEPFIREHNIRLEDIVTHEQIRDAYNEYARLNNQPGAPHKPDINQRNYMRIITELLKRVYYKKVNNN